MEGGGEKEGRGNLGRRIICQTSDSLITKKQIIPFPFLFPFPPVHPFVPLRTILDYCEGRGRLRGKEEGINGGEAGEQKGGRDRMSKIS